MTTDGHWLTLPNLATGSPCLIWLPLPLAPTRPVEQCARTARALRLDHPVSGGAIPLRKALKAVLETAPYSQYEVMTKQAYNLPCMQVLTTAPYPTGDDEAGVQSAHRPKEAVGERRA